MQKGEKQRELRGGNRKEAMGIKKMVIINYPIQINIQFSRGLRTPLENEHEEEWIKMSAIKKQLVSYSLK